MKKIIIEISELNKLYDEIYYANLSEIEQGLEIISNVIYEKEFENSTYEIATFSDVIDTIINVLDEVSEILYNEGLYDINEYIRNKIDKIYSGKLDEVIEKNYLLNSDIYFNEDDYYIQKSNDLYEDDDLCE